MFSVVITTKDRNDFLQRSVESVINSTARASEIIIVNDGGNVLTKNMIDDATDIPFIIINNKKSMGANYSRNIGVSSATTELIFLLDDDDKVTRQSFEKRLDIAKMNPSAGIIFTGIKIVTSSNLDKIKRVVFPENNVTYNRLLSEGNVIGSTSRVLIRKKIFMKAGGFDEKLSSFQDYDLWIRMSKISNVVHDNCCGVIYTVHEHGTQISSNFNKYLKSGLYLYQKYQGELIRLRAVNKFMASIYMRVSLSSTSSSEYIKCKYALLSFIKSPSIKAIMLMIVPAFVLRRLFKFA